MEGLFRVPMAVAVRSAPMPPSSFWKGRALSGTLPLITLSGVLFVAAVVAFAVAPHTGPSFYPLWGLLLTLGFVAAIGATLSAYSAMGEPARAAPRRVPPPRSPATPEPAFGRPRPDVESVRSTTPTPVVAAPTATGPSPAVVPVTVPVVPAGGPAPEPAAWDEDSLPPPSPRGPRPNLSAPSNEGEVEMALREIANIERELESRIAEGRNARSRAARP